MKQDKSKLAVDTYEKIAGRYAEEYFNDLSDSQYLDKFLSYLPPKSKVLDIGSGPGQFSKYIKEKGFDVMGVDYSEEMLKISKVSVKDVEFKRMDMRKLIFEDNRFDGLLVAYSLIHIPSKEIPKTLKGLARVLKNGGVIEIIAQKGKANQIIDEPFMPSEKMFFNFFTKNRLSKFLVKAGFEIIFQEETPSMDPNSVGNRIIYTIAKKV